MPRQMRIPTDPNSREECAQLLLPDIGRQDLLRGVLIDQRVPHSCEVPVRQTFPTCQQPFPVCPLGVDFAASAVFEFPRDPPANFRHRHICELD